MKYFPFLIMCFLMSCTTVRTPKYLYPRPETVDLCPQEFLEVTLPPSASEWIIEIDSEDSNLVIQKLFMNKGVYLQYRGSGPRDVRIKLKRLTDELDYVVTLKIQDCHNPQPKVLMLESFY